MRRRRYGGLVVVARRARLPTVRLATAAAAAGAGTAAGRSGVTGGGAEAQAAVSADGGRVDASEVQVGVDGADDGAQSHQHQQHDDGHGQHLMTSRRRPTSAATADHAHFPTYGSYGSVNIDRHLRSAITADTSIDCVLHSSVLFSNRRI